MIDTIRIMSSLRFSSHSGGYSFITHISIDGIALSSPHSGGYSQVVGTLARLATFFPA